MGREDLKITLIQSVLHWENREKNLAAFREKIESIPDQTDLIILPEMFTTGFTMNAAANAEVTEDITLSWMKSIALKRNCVITGSIIVREGEKYFNRLIWMTPDGYSTYDKRHLFGLAEENKYFHPGAKKIFGEIKGWKILPLICYDLRFPVWSRNTASAPYDLLVYVANWPERRVHAWKQLLIARAIENQSYVAGVNRIGTDENNIFYSGDSVVIDFKGEVINQMVYGGEEIKTTTLSALGLQEFRSHFPFQDDADRFEVVA